MWLGRGWVPLPSSTFEMVMFKIEFSNFSCYRSEAGSNRLASELFRIYVNFKSKIWFSRFLDFMKTISVQVIIAFSWPFRALTLTFEIVLFRAGPSPFLFGFLEGSSKI